MKLRQVFWNFYAYADSAELDEHCSNNVICLHLALFGNYLKEYTKVVLSTPYGCDYSQINLNLLTQIYGYYNKG